MFAWHDPHGFAPEFDFVQVVHGQEGLVGLGHLYESCVFFVEEDLDPVDVAVDAEQSEQVVALGAVLVQVRHQQDASGAQGPGVRVACKNKVSVMSLDLTPGAARVEPHGVQQQV